MEQPHLTEEEKREAEKAINFLSRLCHRLNERWWVDPTTGRRKERNVGELLMLDVSELAEAMEGHRKGLADDKLPQYPMFDVELIDSLVRTFDILGALAKAPPGEVFVAKCVYNTVRKDHTHEARQQPGGKAY